MAKLLAIIIISILVEIDCASDKDMQSCSKDRKCCPRACPSGFEYFADVDACYKVIFELLDWNSSKQVCKDMTCGAHLAAITSSAKQQAIRNYLEKEFSKSESSVCVTEQWFGKSVWTSGQAKDPKQCGTPYHWKTLRAVEIPFDYTNWIAGEPNCRNDVETCVHVAPDMNYQWNDNECSDQKCFLCEF